MCAGLGTAAVIDIRQRRIPNVVCVATAAAGLTLAMFGISSITCVGARRARIGFLMMLPGTRRSRLALFLMMLPARVRRDRRRRREVVRGGGHVARKRPRSSRRFCSSRSPAACSRWSSRFGADGWDGRWD